MAKTTVVAQERSSGGVGWQVLDLDSLSEDTRDQYNEMVNLYIDGKEEAYLEKQELFYAVVRAAVPVPAGQKLSVVFRPPRVDVAVTEIKLTAKKGIKKGTFQVPPQQGSQVRRVK
jgi:hypothetical protein